MTRTSDRPRGAAVGTALVERPFDPTVDLPAMVELITDVNRFDDIEWFPTVQGLANDWTPTPMFDPARDVRLAFDGDRLVGAIRVSWREREGAVVHRVEPWVHPDVRRRGLGSRLLAWGEARARESIRDGSGGPGTLPHVFGANTGSHDAAGVAFAKSHGYVAARFHFGMRRDLSEPIPDAPLPDGLEIRPVRPEHHRAIWLADVEAFRDHWDASAQAESDFVQWFSEPEIDTSLWQVAWDGDEVAGLVVNGIYPHENEQLGLKIGWLDSVATRRPWRRRGLASALITRSLAVLRERGMEIASLGVDTENPTGALRIYERFGFRPHRTWVFYRKPI